MNGPARWIGLRRKDAAGDSTHFGIAADRFKHNSITIRDGIPFVADSKAGDSPNGYLRTADLLGALSLGADLAVGLSEDHAARACYIGAQIAGQMELLPEEMTDLYYAELLMDSGCTAWTSPLAGMLQGDEMTARKDLYVQSVETDSKHTVGAFVWLLKYMAPGAPLHVREGPIS